jgi:catechol 2,3-dioxygenase-like lactoylglutathione lyase family enzyme
MTRIGNHLKIVASSGLRDRCRAFYQGLLGCRPLESPRPDLDLYEFEEGFVLGIFFVSPEEALPEAAYLKATWLELKVPDPEAVKERLLAFGVTPVDFPDPTRFFFQAPGGQVFRLAPIDGGL